MSEEIPDKYLPLCQKEDEHFGCYYLIKMTKVNSKNWLTKASCALIKFGQKFVGCPVGNWNCCETKESEPMKINLHKLACELAKHDNPENYNANVIAAETTLSALGQKLRAVTTAEAFAIVQAIAERGGK